MIDSADRYTPTPAVSHAILAFNRDRDGDLADGIVVTHKLLSSGAVRGVVGAGSSKQFLIDKRRMSDPPGFWANSKLVFPDQGGDSWTVAKVLQSEGHDGTLCLEQPLPQSPIEGTPYELRSGLEAPVLAIRYLMGLAPNDPVGPVDVYLGTTRATNALLERKGARVALVTTKGFGDLLKIGYQDRPHLFKLHIEKRDELFDKVVEIDERMSAEGTILRRPDEREIREALEFVRSREIDALAIVFLHAHVNPAHEEMVAAIAEEVGFAHVSVSSRVARLERIVPRGDTTVVDAYLGRVIQDFVTKIRLALPDSRVCLMTSHGGIIAAEAVKGKDTILSGPAGGVVGCARVIQAAGFTKAIGFDMGGTSTDVSRIDPPPHPFEYQHETVKAGVRLVTPMLAIETVAAGGGSVCAFDGQMLTVGPESAGADPGPACYGRGGPLTVTDMNVFLGRIVPDLFPFRLDVEAVRSRLDVLANTIAQSTTKRLAPNKLADGFVQIANANMASAIKRISVAKGYDVRDYVLASFGGAGGQHACAVARMLGMPRIHISRFSGVLSAVGIGVADIKRIAERSVCCPLNTATVATLEPVTREMTESLREELVAQGMGSDPFGPARTTWDLCYRGQSSLVTVDAGPADAARRAFEASHQRLYGYVHENRDVEIRVIRVEQAAARDRAVSFDHDPAGAAPSDWNSTPMIVAGSEISVPVLTRFDLGTDSPMDGPVIIVENTSTIVVDEGWRAQMLSGGDLLLSDLQIEPAREKKSTQADPIRLELFNNQFTAIAQQMGATLRRTALSTNVRERLDYSCAIFTARGELVVNAPHIPVHLGGMSDCVKCLMEDVGEFAPGDVLITNDPYRGGSHLNDVTVMTPVHDTKGERVLFFVASRAHHAEIGGTRPGSMPPDSQSLAEEGVLIRAFRWVRDGRPQQEEMRRILKETGQNKVKPKRLKLKAWRQKPGN
ncbi:MAG: hydantoinase B/oxoprolinase family protein, partial [Planctomycetes bacterium]|nr:hydantoinase B/oxoprolinase family protein [Planctomycetota bacterium]